MRILIKQVNWLGDLVMTLPATRAVRDRFPDAEIAILVRQELAGFYDGFDWIDDVITYRIRPGLSGLADQARLAARLRRRHFSLAVLFPRSFRAALWVAMAAIPTRVGYRAQGRAFLLTESCGRQREQLEKHQMNDHLDLVRHCLGAAGGDTIPELPVAASHRESIRAWLASRRQRHGPLVALAVAAAYGPAKEWPKESFARLIDLLDREHDAECVLIGAPHEADRCREVAALAKTPAIVAAGQTSVGELIALLSLCDGFAGNDSGAMHVAAALGRPAVGIFGSTNPQRTGPLGAAARVVYKPIECSPCLQRRCRFSHYECLTSIGERDIAAALSQVWTPPKPFTGEELSG